MEESLQNQVEFVYDYSNFHRTVNAHGVVGGLTPTGEIAMAFFSERAALPKRSRHNVSDEGILGDLTTVEVDGLFHRDFEVEVFVNILSARHLHEWLGERIAEWERNHGGVREESVQQ